MWIAIISGIVTLVALIVLILKFKSDKLTIYNIKVCEAENELDALFEKKLSLLTSLQKALEERENDYQFKFAFDKENTESDSFKLNSILNKAYKELKEFLEEKRSYIPDDEVKQMLEELYNIDIECIATKNYYNDKTIILNNKINKFLNKLIAKFKHIPTREIYVDPVEEEFEILKKK